MTDPNKAPEVSGRVADATDDNWVDRFCPDWTRPYLRLSRADRPAGTWLLLIPCWWGLFLAIWSENSNFRAEDVWLVVALAAGAFLMRGAGCTWNDIMDRDFDAQVARTKSRPLPSGQATTKSAVIWMLVQALFAFGILLSFNPFSILLGIAALLPAAIYPFAKRFTWWPQVFLGLAFNWGALLGWAAHTGSLAAAPLALYAAGIFWTLFYDSIYAYQDIEDDALIGVKSTAQVFGKNSKKWLAGFMLSCVICLTIAIGYAFQDGINILSLLTLILGLSAFGWHLNWQLRVLDIEKPEVCLMLFRANRDTGLIFAGFTILAILVQIRLPLA